ncbi:MAG: hypothetical protein IKT99_07805 [Oscillospiraceae bacterium]|nr:hypothetical protein [Oscillospiraceae bacterium]
MNGHQIDELLKRKVDNARRGRTLRTVAAVLALLVLIALIGTAIHRHKTKAVNVPDAPSAVESEDEPSSDEPEAETSPATEGQKPLQPEEMRRKQIKHELALRWVGVSEEDMPPLVTITVVQHGQEVTRFTLSEESEWRHSWTDDYPAESLSLRADLPKSIIASFTLRGNEFTVICSGGTGVPTANTGAESGEDETPAEETSEPETEDQDGETGDPEETGSEGEAPAEAPSEEETPDEAASDEKASSEAESDGETNEISDPPKSGHSWWPIVILMLCGAVLVTLGMLGTDRRRSR